MSKKPLYISHRDDTHQGGTAPTHAHMALQTGKVGDPAGILQIPEGSHIFIIENPRKANTIFELILEKVVFDNGVPKELRFVAYTKNWKSTRRVVFHANWMGEYQSGLDADQQGAKARMEGRDPKDPPK